MQSDLNDRFAHIGFNLSTGYAMPTDWTDREKFLFQETYTFAQELLQTATEDDTSGRADANYWDIVNFDIGVYPNKWKKLDRQNWRSH